MPKPDTIAPVPYTDTPFDEALSQRYLVYALSTITARSLPDVRDGLKPVHRRLLWGMRLLRLDPASAYKKCARVVGDVMGKYHPHGDASIYDAMVRLAQTFSLRYPLVDGQGNFGNVDGDNAAAMRYTEARLTQAAILLMDGLDEDTVAFRPTYNGEEEEPEVFPGLFPNLLANGASGIAVGMATSIPPHNAAELIDAVVHLIDQPEATTADLLEYVQGPDFPTGGIVADAPAAIREAYETGRGSFRTRARFGEPEKLGGGTWQLVITEIPYQVPKAKLIEQIALLITDKKLPILADVRDESDERNPHRARAALALGRSRHAQGQPLPADRSRGAHIAEPQRARCDADAARDEPGAGVVGLSRAPDRGADQSLEASARQDRRPHRTARRLPDRLSQPRSRDRDYPL